jgi:mannose-6-phosphate isomerase-like protein (cupin superfamily)
MGKVVTFASLQYKQAASGVSTAAITGSDGKEMQAEVIRLTSGAKLAGAVPAGCDRYFFTLTGEATVSNGGGAHRMPTETFATLQESTKFTLENSGKAGAELLSLIVPPPGKSGTHPGFKGGIKVAERRKQPVVDIPDQKKHRIYFVDKSAAASERGHAMIVEYVSETVTGMHMHPNAESMFVVLTGKVRFTVNGKDEVLARGQAVHFPATDRHGLRGEEGDVSFLEFHVPGAFTSVRG